MFVWIVEPKNIRGMPIHVFRPDQTETTDFLYTEIQFRRKIWLNISFSKCSDTSFQQKRMDCIKYIFIFGGFDCVNILVRWRSHWLTYVGNFTSLDVFFLFSSTYRHRFSFFALRNECCCIVSIHCQYTSDWLPNDWRPCTYDVHTYTQIILFVNVKIVIFFRTWRQCRRIFLFHFFFFFVARLFVRSFVYLDDVV